MTESQNFHIISLRQLLFGHQKPNFRWTKTVFSPGIKAGTSLGPKPSRELIKKRFRAKKPIISMIVTVDLTGYRPVEIYDLTDEVEEVAIKIEEPEPEPILCAVCLDPTGPNFTATLSRCGHQFCTYCIAHWSFQCFKSVRAADCPLCKSILTQSEEKRHLDYWNYLEESKAENQF